MRLLQPERPLSGTKLSGRSRMFLRSTSSGLPAATSWDYRAAITVQQLVPNVVMEAPKVSLPSPHTLPLAHCMGEEMGWEQETLCIAMLRIALENQWRMGEQDDALMIEDKDAQETLLGCEKGKQDDEDDENHESKQEGRALHAVQNHELAPKERLDFPTLLPEINHYRTADSVSIVVVPSVTHCQDRKWKVMVEKLSIFETKVSQVMYP